MIGPAVIVWRVLSRRRALIELRLDVLDVAVGTDAVAEQLLEVLLDVLLQRLPLFFVVPNSFAVRADGEQHLELLDLLAQAEDSLRDLEPGAQLVRVHRLGDEIVRPRPPTATPPRAPLSPNKGGGATAADLRGGRLKGRRSPGRGSGRGFAGAGGEDIRALGRAHHEGLGDPATRSAPPRLFHGPPE